MLAMYLAVLDNQSSEEQFKDVYNTYKRSFHEAVLRIGPAPFDIIKKYLLDYIPESGK